MKTFKLFFEQTSEPEPISIPVVPTHGGHSCPKPEKKIEEGNMPPTKVAHDWIIDHDNNHLGKNMLEVHRKLDTPAGDWNKQPNSEHTYRYSNYSYDLNEHLIQKHKAEKDPFYNSSPSMTKKHETVIKGIDKHLKSSKLTHDLHVYHGTVGFNPDKLAAQHPQRKIKSHAFMSTSVNKNLAHQFAGGTGLSDNNKNKAFTNIEAERANGAHILHIHLKPGQHGKYLGSNSKHHDEKEFLLPRNTTLKVHPDPTVLHDGTKIWHSHVVKR
jgi:hypothetical protein